jgi:adenosine deaminase
MRECEDVFSHFLRQYNSLNNYQNHINRPLYKSIPKVELHRHMEGSLRLSTMLEIAKKFNLDLPFGNIEKFQSLVQIDAGEPCTFQNFLSKFSTLRYFYQSPEVIKQITRETIIDAAEDNIKYFELRFTPAALTRIKDFPLGEAMDWIIETAEETSKEFGIKTKLIASMNRHESVRDAEAVIQLAIDRKDDGIVAVDLAGDEANFPGNQFIGVFEEARQAEMHITIHGGEWAGPENIALAINKLHAKRIGHGVRIFEDKSIVDLVMEKNIHFEVCPTSNYQSGIFSDIADHSLGKMQTTGINYSINTDDPSISQIVLTDEYLLANEVFGITLAQILDSNINAAKAAFIPQTQKDKLVKSLKVEYSNLLSSQT